MAAVIVLFLAMVKVKTNHTGTENVKNKNDWAGEEMIANNSASDHLSSVRIEFGFPLFLCASVVKSTSN